MSFLNGLAEFLRGTPEPSEPDVSAPIEDLPRLLAAGLVEDHDFRRYMTHAGACFCARTPAGRRWMALDGAGGAIGRWALAVAPLHPDVGAGPPQPSARGALRSRR